MARSTGPIVAAGVITFANQAVLGDAPDDFKLGARVAVGTALAAMGLAAVERLSEKGAVGLAWLALVSVLFVKPAGQQAPVERALTWWNKTK